MKTNVSANIQFSFLEASYWMSFCAVIGYAAVWLQSLGYSSSSTGIILALGSSGAFILQTVLARLADKSSKWNAVTVVKLLSVLIVLSSLCITLLNTKGIIMSLFMCIILASINAGQSFVTSVMYFLETKDIHINFGICRAVGSIAYALISYILGILVETVSSLSIPICSFILGVLMFLCITSVKENHSSSTSQTQRQSGGYISFFKEHPKYLILLIGVTFIFFSHTLVNNFEILIVQNVGGNTADLGSLVAFQACIELPGMIFAGKLMDHFGIKRILIFSLIMYSVKEVLFFTAGSIPMLYFALLFQSVSFALFIPASVAYASAVASMQDQVKAQTCFVMTNTLSTIFSSIIGGALFDYAGVPSALLIGAVISIIGTVTGILCSQNV